MLFKGNPCRWRISSGPPSSARTGTSSLHPGIQLPSRSIRFVCSRCGTCHRAPRTHRSHRRGTAGCLEHRCRSGSSPPSWSTARPGAWRFCRIDGPYRSWDGWWPGRSCYLDWCCSRVAEPEQEIQCPRWSGKSTALKAGWGSACRPSDLPRRLRMRDSPVLAAGYGARWC